MERKRAREMREREQRRKRVFQLLIDSPNAFNSLRWVIPKPGVKNSTLVSHMGGKGLNI